jgi:hypothetical protein
LDVFKRMSDKDESLLLLLVVNSISDKGQLFLLCLCGLVVRVLATGPEVPSSISGPTRFSEN